MSLLLYRKQQNISVLHVELAFTWATVAKWKPEKDEFQEAISGYWSKKIAKQTETAIGIHCDMFILCLEKAFVFLKVTFFFPNDAFLYLSYEMQIVR